MFVCIRRTLFVFSTFKIIIFFHLYLKWQFTATHQALSSAMPQSYEQL